jgi:hypothetical protein
VVSVVEDKGAVLLKAPLSGVKWCEAKVEVDFDGETMLREMIRKNSMYPKELQ